MLKFKDCIMIRSNTKIIEAQIIFNHLPSLVALLLLQMFMFVYCYIISPASTIVDCCVLGELWLSLVHTWIINNGYIWFREVRWHYCQFYSPFCYSFHDYCDIKSISRGTSCIGGVQRCIGDDRSGAVSKGCCEYEKRRPNETGDGGRFFAVLIVFTAISTRSRGVWAVQVGWSDAFMMAAAVPSREDVVNP